MTDETNVPEPTATETPQEEKKNTKGKSDKTIRTIENCKLLISSIKLPDTWNRNDPGKLDTLVNSLKKHGQLVAIVVRPGSKPGEYELVDGRRRLLAMQEAGIKEAIATVTDSIDSTDAYTKSFVVNYHRKAHNPMELAEIFATLSETKKNKEIAKECEVSEGTVSQHLALRNLPPKFQTALRKETLLISEARELCRLDVEEDAEELEKIGNALVEASIDAFEAADKITAYLERKEEKASAKAGTKNKKKAGKKSEDSEGKEDARPGRPVKVKDYTLPEIRSQVKMVNKDTLISSLTTLADKLSRTSSQKNQAYLKGRIDQAEIDGGLRDD